MAQATGLSPRRAYHLDQSTVLVGDVLAGARGRAAETRTGAKRLLNTSLSAQMTYKAVLFGQTSNAAGGYLVQVAHVAPGGALPADNSANWVTVAALEVSGIDKTEVPLSGAAIHRLAKTAASLTTETPRPVAVRAVAGTGSLTISNVALTNNVATVTVGANTVAVGDIVTVACSNTVFNGTYVVTARTSTTISYSRSNADVSSGSATGSVTNGVAAPVGTLTLTLQPDA